MSTPVIRLQRLIIKSNLADSFAKKLSNHSSEMKTKQKTREENEKK